MIMYLFLDSVPDQGLALAICSPALREEGMKVSDGLITIKIRWTVESSFSRVCGTSTSETHAVT